MSSKSMNVETIATYMASIKPATKEKQGSRPQKKYISKPLILKTIPGVFGIAFIFLTLTSTMASENLEGTKRLEAELKHKKVELTKK